MEALGLFFLGLTVLGILLFVFTIKLVLSLQKKIKGENPRLGKALGLIGKSLWGIPIALFVYQYYADSQYIDTNDMWIAIILYAPLVLFFVVVTLAAINFYIGTKKK